MIFFSLKPYSHEGEDYDFKARVNFAVFPSLQVSFILIHSH